ncbi:WbuC family cupin fold metalloprotein [Candidatus Ponderosibacter sp. Uisw_141_02]|uniref:WbuC family cupin fold metalloprotein n=1 Tax=Candidatus Ponderosibacter sp. Uisw_141_02 TaxID=3231000 RepID=UPI003D46F18F
MNSIKFKQINESVFQSNLDVFILSDLDVNFLKDQALSSANKRCRICLHQKPTDLLHEMIIALHRDTLVRPHKHHAKTESFHMIEGKLDVVLFNDCGTICEIISLSSEGLGSPSYYRLNSKLFHTVLVQSEFAVFQEVTNGPFEQQDTEFACFSPSDEEGLSQYLRELRWRKA